MWWAGGGALVVMLKPRKTPCQISPVSADDADRVKQELELIRETAGW